MHFEDAPPLRLLLASLRADSGGHAWSTDGWHFTDLVIGAFGPVIRFANGSYWYTAYVERPQAREGRGKV